MEYNEELCDQMNYQINEYRGLAARMELLKDAAVAERNEQRNLKDRVIVEQSEEISALKKQVDMYQKSLQQAHRTNTYNLKILRQEQEKRGRLWVEFNKVKKQLGYFTALRELWIHR